MECIKFIVRVFTLMIISVTDITILANIFLNPHCIKENLSSTDIYRSTLGLLQITVLAINMFGLLFLIYWAWR